MAAGGRRSGRRLWARPTTKRGGGTARPSHPRLKGGHLGRHGRRPVRRCPGPHIPWARLPAADADDVSDAHPVTAKAAAGQRLHRLQRDPKTAPVVERLFVEYNSGRGYGTIAEGLTADLVPSPSENDRARNPHRHRRGWQPSAVRAILTNPVYMGRSVRALSRREEVLIDIHDVALGHETKMRRNNPDRWVRSEVLTHEAIIDETLFERVQTRIRAKGGSHASRSRRSDATHVYPFRDRLRCALCGRAMEGATANGTRRYRCVYRRAFKQANDIEHPNSVYVREDDLTTTVDDWLSKLFDPAHIDDTLPSMVAAQAPSAEEHARRARATEQVAECDRKLDLYRKTLEAGGDPPPWPSGSTTHRQNSPGRSSPCQNDRRPRG